ncbi:hypothetical protein MBLNU230_g0639t1 [Neophaeotheca triangularis]
MAHQQASGSSALASNEEMHDRTTELDSKTANVQIDDTPRNVASDDHMQDGVKQAEALTMAWTKKSLGLAYALMFLLYFINYFQQSISASLSPYITSDFDSHSLVPLIGVVSSVMSAATYMPLSKILNMFDRWVGFALMVALATLGLVMTASCNSIGTYCAATVFYSIGYAGMTFAIDVITLDTSTLRNRGLAYAFTSSPNIIVAYAGPNVAQKFYAENWRWAFGAFAIILPVFAVPMILVLLHAKGQAKKKGLLQPRAPSDRTFMQSVSHYLIEFDIVGTFLLTAGLVVFLLPFNIHDYLGNGWGSAGFIAMLVIGVALLVSFVLWERYFARVPFLPWNIACSRTVLAACVLDVCYDVSYYSWASYYTSFLQVNCGVSIAVAGYVNNIFDVVSGFWLFAVGYMIHKTCRYRWLLYWILPLYILGIGLMLHFRQPDQSIGYLVMCQIFMALSGGALIIVMQVAVLASSDHNNAASALAFLNVFGNIGAAVGGSISSAVWQGTFPQALEKYLPADVLPDLDTIYEDLTTQLSYAKGTAARYAIELSYSFAQRNMLIAGTSIMAIAIACAAIMRDLKLDRAQTKGVLF